MECKFKGVSRIKLFISGRKDFLYFDLPNNMKVENLKSVIATMYNFDSRSISLYLNNICLEDYKGKTIEQINKGGEISLIMTNSKHKKNTSNNSSNYTPNCSLSKNQSKIHSRDTSPLVTESSCKLKRSISNISSSRNNLHSTAAIHSNSNSSLIFDASLSISSSRSKLTTSSRSLSKSNYIFKKDLELLDKEVEFIKGCTTLLHNKINTGSGEEYHNYLKNIDELDDLINKINFNFSKIREMAKADLENEKNDFEMKKDNYKCVIEEVDQYKEEISKCTLFYEIYLIFSFRNVLRFQNRHKWPKC